MAIEIERKFLLASDAWRAEVQSSVRMVQGYFEAGFCETPPPTVRVRIAGERAFLTVKGRPSGVIRSEFEYEIPVPDAEAMLREFCGSRIVEKQRCFIPEDDGRVWEIDEYFGRNAGLFTAELELDDADAVFERPIWLGAEVSGDPRYTNGALSRRPYSLWSDPA